MRIGLGAGAGTISQAVDETRQAAADGFAAVWFSNIFGLDAITTCAVAGREVDGIELGTAVVPTFPRHPYAMAQQAATAQDACGGRFVLGIGLSHQIVIESMLGMSFDKPAIHMREYLSVLMPLLRDGAVSFSGDLYSVQATVDRPAGGPPVLVAALGPVMLKLAGRFTEGTATWMTGPNTLGEYIVPTILAAASDAGRPEPRIVAALPVCVTTDIDGARQRAGEVFAIYGNLPSYRAMLDREGAEGPADVAIVGDEEAVLAGIRQLEDVGVTDFGASLFGSGDEVSRTRTLLKSLL